MEIESGMRIVGEIGGVSGFGEPAVGNGWMDAGTPLYYAHVA